MKYDAKNKSMDYSKKELEHVHSMKLHGSASAKKAAMAHKMNSQMRNGQNDEDYKRSQSIKKR